VIDFPLRVRALSVVGNAVRSCAGLCGRLKASAGSLVSAQAVSKSSLLDLPNDAQPADK
jgi:hypothetical protein